MAKPSAGNSGQHTTGGIQSGIGIGRNSKKISLSRGKSTPFKRRTGTKMGGLGRSKKERSEAESEFEATSEESSLSEAGSECESAGEEQHPSESESRTESRRTPRHDKEKIGSSIPRGFRISRSRAIPENQEGFYDLTEWSENMEPGVPPPIRREFLSPLTGESGGSASEIESDSNSCKTLHGSWTGDGASDIDIESSDDEEAQLGSLVHEYYQQRLKRGHSEENDANRDDNKSEDGENVDKDDGRGEGDGRGVEDELPYPARPSQMVLHRNEKRKRTTVEKTSTSTIPGTTPIRRCGNPRARRQLREPDLYTIQEAAPSTSQSENGQEDESGRRNTEEIHNERRESEIRRGEEFIRSLECREEFPKSPPNVRERNGGNDYQFYTFIAHPTRQRPDDWKPSGRGATRPSYIYFKHRDHIHVIFAAQPNNKQRTAHQICKDLDLLDTERFRALTTLRGKIVTLEKFINYLLRYGIHTYHKVGKRHHEFGGMYKILIDYLEDLISQGDYEADMIDEDCRQYCEEQTFKRKTEDKHRTMATT